MNYADYTCDACGVSNYVYMGDPQDCTSSYGESPACECWSCGNKFWIADLSDSEVVSDLECYDLYDSRKTPEENLKDCDAEEGYPSDNVSSKHFEKFLDATSSNKDMTWRGWILRWLDAERAAMHRTNDDLRFSDAKRPERVDIVRHVLSPPSDGRTAEKMRMGDMFSGDGGYHFVRNCNDDFLSAGFVQHEGMDCRKLTDKKNDKGGFELGEVDWVAYRAKFGGLLMYMTGIGWYEINGKDKAKKIQG